MAISNQLTQNQIRNNQALKFIKYLLLIGIGSVFLFALKTLWWEKINNPIINFISIFSVGALIAGSALTGGALTGFIFAIPKSVANSSDNLIRAGTGYISNDNLVQVSDWVTKIIIGVGLTKLTRVPGYVQSVGKYAGPSLGGSIWGEVAVEGIMLYFLICGFLLAYLWTRLYFARMLNEADTIEQVPDAAGEAVRYPEAAAGEKKTII